MIESGCFRVGMIPSPKGDDWERNANPHLAILVGELSRHGWEVVPLEYSDLSKPCHLEEKRIKIVWLHWPSALFDIQAFSLEGMLSRLSLQLGNRSTETKTSPLGVVVRTILKVSSAAFRLLNVCYVKIVAPLKINLIVKSLEASALPVVWEQHDLGSHHIVDGACLADVDRLLHEELYRVSSAIIIHERSCLQPVFEAYGTEKEHCLAHLGPFYYGPRKEKERARQDLDISGAKIVFAYVGTARQNRNPAATIDAFQRVARDRDVLIVAGMGVSGYSKGAASDQRVVVFDGFLEPERLRDIFCAADFVVNDGKRYLTSAVVRAAMGYGVPVIVQPFGSSLDMAQSAAIYIGEGGLEEALEKALGLSETDHMQMQREALLRDAERTWEASGESLDLLFRRVVSAWEAKHIEIRKQ